MPDMHAFDNEANSSRDRSLDDTISSGHSRPLPQSPRLLCPPTPVRTPVWANVHTSVRPVLPPRGHVKFTRANSLVTTKVLATCPPQVVDGRASLENSSLDGDKSRDSMESRDLPPPIKTVDSEDWDVKAIDGDREGSSHFDKSSWLSHDSLHTERLSLVSAPAEPPSPPVQRDQSVGQDDPAPVVSMATHFEVMSTLGSGAFADVFRVRSKVDGGFYAVKRNRRHFRGRRDREKAMAEVKWMQRLQTPCTKHDAANVDFSLYILFFFQAWQEDCHFLVQTELCCRDTLADLLESLRSKWPVAESRYPSLRQLPPLSSMTNNTSFTASDGRLCPEASIWKICHDVAAGLSHIHSHGLVHFDIKPANVFFVTHVRLGALCKIGDFGMCGETGSSEDGQEGDQRYMAAEILQSDKKHPSADIFSLGIMLYELASYPTFVLPGEGTRWRHLRSSTLDMDDIPPCRSSELLNVLRSTRQPNKDDRPLADTLLTLEPVAAAGSCCENFLRSYITDVEEFDRWEEERLVHHHEDKTPRAQKPQFRVCSPLTGNYLAQDKMMHSPEAASS